MWRVGFYSEAAPRVNRAVKKDRHARHFFFFSRLHCKAFILWTRVHSETFGCRRSVRNINLSLFNATV